MVSARKADNEEKAAHTSDEGPLAERSDELLLGAGDASGGARRCNVSTRGIVTVGRFLLFFVRPRAAALIFGWNAIGGWSSEDELLRRALGRAVGVVPDEALPLLEDALLLLEATTHSLSLSSSSDGASGHTPVRCTPRINSTDSR